MPFVDTSRLKPKEPLPGWKGRFFHSDNLTFAYYEVSSGASIYEHSHDNEEVWNVIEGELEITLDGDTRRAAAGVAAVVPPNIPHSVRALSDARALVVDHPVRDSVAGVSLD